MKTINISQKDVAAMKAYKNDVTTMANHFGISVKDMRDVLNKFGFAKTKSKSDYVINLDFDFPVNTVNTEAELVNDIHNMNSPAVTPVYDSTVDAFVHTPVNN
jgi:hypothetical protein